MFAVLERHINFLLHFCEGLAIVARESLQKGLFSLRRPFLQGLVKMLHT